MKKYIFCFYLEKIHRWAFDKVYLQEHRTTWIEWGLLRVYYFLETVYPDYREYLKQWHTGTQYERYKSYFK